tara:strand:- start:324 stop:881 length:558 start_codon:yes stop_codon:yes gene_type:complete
VADLTPFLKLANGIDALAEHTGRIVAWFSMGMVLVQFTIVLMRYVFGVSSIWMQESIFYMHGFLFMLAAGYTLYRDDHVRVDIFYREASPRYKASINLLGTIFFLWPVCALIWYAAFPYVEISWIVLEGSRETSGIPAIFLLKSAILAFAVLVSLQGLSTIIRAAHTLKTGIAPQNPNAERTISS